MVVLQSLGKLSRLGQCAVLLLLSLFFAWLLRLAGLPAALLLGPMLAGIVIGTNGGTIRMPRAPFTTCQAVIGCMIAMSITPAILVEFVHEWPIFLGTVLSTVVATSVLGYGLSRWGGLPGTTGVWGSSAGAASAMVVMAEAFGADPRLVAFMQYMRVVCVAGGASLLARFWLSSSTAAPVQMVWFPPIQWLNFGTALLIIIIGGWVARRFRVPAGGVLVPMLFGALLHGSGLVSLQLPEWLLAMAYAVLGWTIGLGFTRQVLRHASRALPQILISIFILLAFCGGLAWLLVRTLGVDALTAYLATSPGGIDSVAIIAASSHVDMSFIMALQTVRLFVVVLIGPSLARFTARAMKLHTRNPPLASAGE